MARSLFISALLLTPLALVASTNATGSADASAELANADDVCPPGDPTMDKYRYLRSLSIDLRGDVPEVDELLALETTEDVPASTLDDWLDDDAFTTRVQKLHRDLLWNNVTNLRLMSNNSLLRSSSGGYYRGDLGTVYRGMRNAPCLDQPVTYTSSGAIQTFLQEDGSRREGYVMVAPYWAPDTQVKVCAFDAQTAAVSPAGNRCDTLDAYRDAACGCGPSLRWCARDSERQEVLSAMSEDVNLRVAQVIDGDRSYLELFTGKTAWVNGPLVHFLRYQTGLPGDVRLTPSPVRLEVLPDLPYTARETWVELPLGEEHAGVLTSPAFLLRFMSNRARANRFYSNFLCQPFVPPESGIVIDENDPTLDLQEKSGCNGCHQVLEPAASYWGRWTESGGGYLSPDAHPGLSDECRKCASNGGCSDMCKRHYVYRAITEEENPWIGWMRWYEFRDEDHFDHVEEGPALLAARSVTDNRLPLCTTRTAATWLLGRAPLEEEEEWVQRLSIEFVSSGYDYRSLIRNIVTSPVYRRVQ